MVKEDITAEKLRKIFANNLIYYMNKLGLDRNDICQRLNLPYMTVSDWYNARKYPRIEKIEALAQMFGVPKSALIEECNIGRQRYSDENDEVWAMREALQKRPELKVLFDLTKNATTEDIEKTISIVETLMR